MGVRGKRSDMTHDTREGSGAKEGMCRNATITQGNTYIQFAKLARNWPSQSQLIARQYVEQLTIGYNACLDREFMEQQTILLITI